MRILFVSPWFPYPPSSGVRLRNFHLLRALAPAHEVALLSFADQSDVDPAAPPLRALCPRIDVFPLPAFDPAAWRSRLAWLSPRPRSLVVTFSPAMAAAVERAAAACDLIVASDVPGAAYAPWFRGTPALLEGVELGALYGQLASPRPIERWRARLMWAKYRRYLRGLLRHFRAFTVVSARERELLGAVLGDTRAIHLLPNGIAAAEYHPQTTPRPDTILFTGSFRYPPNYDGMRWFVESVWPRIRRARPGVRLLITGDGAGLTLPAAEGVERTGFVDDLRPLFAASWLAVAPIFSGSGTRVKILEAMAAGTPVVASSKGAEGIEAVDGEHLLLADDPAGFAAHVVALLADPVRRARLALAGRQLVERRYDWRLLGPQFEALVRSLA
jgi:glycosyltransferase involved in cell wall biosynthesis